MHHHRRAKIGHGHEVIGQGARPVVSWRVFPGDMTRYQRESCFFKTL